MDFKGKNVLIMGLGIQGGGVGVARFFAQKGAKVTVTDLKSEDELLPSISSLADFPITYILGKHRADDFKNADLIIRNPDVSFDSPYLKIARENEIPVEMDESLFLKLCPTRENVIGVTGTRGKTTVTLLIGAILQKAGYHTLLGGNLRGIATLSLLDKISSESKVVLELSSWQLQGLGWSKISPHIAVITNIFPDHLNRYKTMDDYIKDKKIIFAYQNYHDFLILNQENGITKELARYTKSKTVWFNKKFIPQKLIDVFRLKGDHNLENLAAAYQVAKILEIDDIKIIDAIRNFSGVNFRLEEVANLDGVTYVNDTTSTMPEATIAALKTYESKSIILIAGGSSKNLKVEELSKEIIKRVKALVLLDGTGTDELVSSIKYKVSSIKILGKFSDVKQAILAAKGYAKKGDTILFSPGFTSFGMFKNEFDRGEQFNEIIKQVINKNKTI
ncbi:MAG: UDP-N-acetylmuramoyl-L-alanine--D-glutamate ligase [Candidatus Gottesmanbacteria bacterium]